MGEIMYYVLQSIKDAKSPIRAKDILDKLLEQGINVGVKSVYQAIENINQFCSLMMGKEYIQTIHRRGYYIENNYFDDGQIHYLLDSIVYNPNLTSKEVEELKKLLVTLSTSNQLARLTIPKNKTNTQSFSLLLNLTTLLKAVTNEQNIYFSYVNYKIKDDRLEEMNSANGNLTIGKDTYYLISPYKVVLRGSHYYVLGYFDQREGKLSMYRVDRMRMIRYHTSKFIEIREQFDVAKDLETTINMFISDKHIDLTFRFKDSILREVVNQFGIHFEVHKDMHNWNVAIVKDITMSDGLLGWIMMLQDQIQIITPLELRDKIVEKIQAMDHLYKEN